MTDLLQGKTALIIGDDAISLGIAERFEAEGAAVTTLVGDDKAAIAAAAGTSLDVLVLGGGDIPAEQDWVCVGDLTLGRLRQTNETMVGRSLLALQVCEQALKRSGQASVIFLSSPAGTFSEGGWSDRTVAYHARHGLMRAVAAEWGPVRANMLVPLADTPGFRRFRARNPGEVDFRVSVLPMRRVGDLVNDIGGAALFLASDDTRYLTAMVVHADGGAFMTVPTVETSIEAA
jgi:NAD(P)-dependent dehydrogenase (short-subunit alcohol dehydrogenase family)